MTTSPKNSMKDADTRNGEPDALEDEIGHDTPTGTDPDARFERSGYEDKSFGQAVDQDRRLVEELAEQTTDEREASERFDRESAGAPARRRQGHPETG